MWVSCCGFEFGAPAAIQPLKEEVLGLHDLCEFLDRTAIEFTKTIVNSKAGVVMMDLENSLLRLERIG